MRWMIFLLVISLTACKTKQRTVSVHDKTDKELLSLLEKRNIDFNWISAKMNATLVTPDENVSGGVQAKIHRDKAILMAIKKFGIEVARVYADPQEYTVLYRFESTYETGPINEIKKLLKIDVDFEDLQQMIAGNIILPDVKHSIITRDSAYFIIDSVIDQLRLKYYINGITLDMDKMTITDHNNRAAVIEYSDYRNIENIGKFAYGRKFTTPYQNGEAILELKFIDVKFSDSSEINFTIPKGYEKIN